MTHKLEFPKQKKWQFKLKDLSRVDCLTQTHAFEVDWADGMKVYEAIGQSLYYASQTDKKPGILLLIRKDNIIVPTMYNHIL